MNMMLYISMFVIMHCSYERRPRLGEAPGEGAARDASLCMCVYVCVCMIYIYIYRERDRYVCVYIFIYVDIASHIRYRQSLRQRGGRVSEENAPGSARRSWRAAPSYSWPSSVMRRLAAPRTTCNRCDSSCRLL